MALRKMVRRITSLDLTSLRCVKKSEFKRSVTKMKYDQLKELPVKERPRMLAPDWNIKYFQGRYFLPVLIIAIISIINGILSILYGKGLFIILFCNIIGIPAVLLTHLSICSGFSSCNTGSYFKATEPIRYWINTGLTFVFYVFSQLAIWWY